MSIILKVILTSFCLLSIIENSLSYNVFNLKWCSRLRSEKEVMDCVKAKKLIGKEKIFRTKDHKLVMGSLDSNFELKDLLKISGHTMKIFLIFSDLETLKLAVLLSNTIDYNKVNVGFQAAIFPGPTLVPRSISPAEFEREMAKAGDNIVSLAEFTSKPGLVPPIPYNVVNFEGYPKDPSALKKLGIVLDVIHVSHTSGISKVMHKAIKYVLITSDPTLSSRDLLDKTNHKRLNVHIDNLEKDNRQVALALDPILYDFLLETRGINGGCRFKMSIILLLFTFWIHSLSNWK